MSALDEMVVHSKQCKKDWLRLRGCSCWSQGAIKELTSLRAENARLQKAVEEATSLIKNITDDSQWFYADKWLKEYGAK